MPVDGEELLYSPTAGVGGYVWESSRPVLWSDSGCGRAWAVTELGR